ncbi:hypothetical protein TNCT_299591 [Trichonephila clavata]|uniref:Uncharacterized protein n=1 Tax=Trichonephila clavata TaxID=2740835 RepID=A0A8X6FDS5_TRICU|nr:hypothetical protein TNCT_299591 [Trichonephila clavata]
MQVLDTETKRLFEMTLESTDIPKWDDFLAFLNKRCLFLENLPSAGTKGTIQPDLFDILLRFRKYVVAFSSDIKKMFRQIKVQEHQQDFLRILWRPSPEEDIVSYRLKTVTYGNKTSSIFSYQMSSITSP